MIKKLKLLCAENLFPHHNQAIERYLLDHSKEGELALYLWANDKTVFIGKNQNAYTECNLSALKESGGFLARRFTGGGAVYHDKGNLNFTFIARKEDYSLERQFSVITAALKNLGLSAILSGRNDVLIEGKKISGNAFYKSEGACLHHGTLLIRADKDAIQKYLTASKVKLESKGVKSVKSRVGNLQEFDPYITCEEVKSALISAFFGAFPNDLPHEVCTEGELEKEELSALEEHFSNENYLLGDNVGFSTRFERRFSWGVADVRLEIERDVIKRARIYSDALDTNAVEEKERLLAGFCLSGEPDPRIRDIIEEWRKEYEV